MPCARPGRQYHHEAVQFDDTRTTGEARTEDAMNPEPGTSFGADVDDLDAETSVPVEYEGDPIQCRSTSLEGSRCSLGSRDDEGADSGLSGRRTQVRTDGDIEALESAELVEVQDRPPEVAPGGHTASSVD